ncbi:hypothetical protein WwSim0239 [Wolbachia endosymbiont of Drosophila simulans]|nr:hypothetical protein WwSim0239 [Wolbachia endosymbiont of Drosophila simulans]
MCGINFPSSQIDRPKCTSCTQSTIHTKYASNSGLNPSISADINSPGETFFTFQVFLFTTLATSAANSLTIIAAFSIVLSITIRASNLAFRANSSVPESFPCSKLDNSTNTAGATISLLIIGYISHVCIAGISFFNILQIALCNSIKIILLQYSLIHAQNISQISLLFHN